MITETTAISCAAFGALSTGLGIAAGLGWIRCARLLLIARDDSAHWRSKADERLKSWNDALEQAGRYGVALVSAQHRATDLEDQLRHIERQRSDTTRKGNLTKAAKRKALVDATTAAVARANAAASAQPAERLAA